MSEKEQKQENEQVDFEVIAKALAKDLVDLSKSVRFILTNSTFNFNAINEVKLVEAITAEILNTYVETNEDNEIE